jgi:excisionase family DNA binding protein
MTRKTNLNSNPSAPPAGLPVLLTTEEVASYLKCCRRTIDRLVAARAISFTKVGGKNLFTVKAVLKFLDGRTLGA